MFDPLYEALWGGAGPISEQSVEVVEGDVARRVWELIRRLRERLRGRLDLVINSSGLTDFNPDLRDALADQCGCRGERARFCSAQSDHAGLMHLSTCYVAGARMDGWARSCGQITLRRA